MTIDIRTERKKYERMWHIDRYRDSSPDMAYLPSFRRRLAPGDGVNIYGCGTGRAGLELARTGHTVAMIDIAANCLDDPVRCAVETDGNPVFVCDCITRAGLKMPAADWGLCCDVLEHLPPDRIDAALDQMRELTPRAYLSISHNPDSFGKLIDDTLHLTVEPIEWWIPKIADRWPKIEIIHAGGVTELVAHSA